MTRKTNGPAFEISEREDRGGRSSTSRSFAIGAIARVTPLQVAPMTAWTPSMSTSFRIALTPSLAGVWWWAVGQPWQSAAVVVEAFVLGLAFWLCITNQIHKWAHVERPPAAVRWLQRRRVILEPGHHAAHHTMPFDQRFCITSGWLNPVVDRLGVFALLERRCRGQDAFAPPKAGIGGR